MLNDTTEKIRYKFWNQFLPVAKKNPAFFKLDPTEKNMMKHWILIPYKGSIHFCVACLKDEHWVEIVIQDEQSDSCRIFNNLKKYKNEIEEKFEENLVWDGKTGTRKRCKIMSHRQPNGYDNLSDWPVIHQSLIDRLNKFYEAVKKYI